jgi:hypothetical protein
MALPVPAPRRVRLLVQMRRREFRESAPWRTRSSTHSCWQGNRPQLREGACMRAIPGSEHVAAPTFCKSQTPGVRIRTCIRRHTVPTSHGYRRARDRGCAWSSTNKRPATRFRKYLYRCSAGQMPYGGCRKVILQTLKRNREICHESPQACSPSHWGEGQGEGLRRPSLPTAVIPSPRNVL